VIDSILQSHLITPQFLRADDFNSFYRHRETQLLETISRAMGKSIHIDSSEANRSTEMDSAKSLSHQGDGTAKETAIYFTRAVRPLGGQLVRKCAYPVYLAARPKVVNPNVLIRYPPRLPKPLLEGLSSRSALRIVRGVCHQRSDPPNAVCF